MFRSKKLIVGVVLAAVLLAGSMGGIALAQTENGDESQPGTRLRALLEKVCAIYNANPDRTGDIDCDLLETALTKARSETRPEGMPEGYVFDPEARQERLQNLYDEGKISEEQYLKMKDRMESMPDNLSGFGFHDHGRFRGMGGMRGFGGLCATAE